MTYRSEYAKIINFIDKSLPTKLTNDQKSLKITSEGDLQSCTYYHLRKFFRKENLNKWHIQNKLSMGDKKTSKQYPDIVISWMEGIKPRGNYADILIELKETMKFKEDVADNEIEKLEAMIEDYNSSGVFIYACLDKREGRKVKETNGIMEEMVSKNMKKYMIVKTINIKGKKTFDADMDYFDEKVDILRKYRTVKVKN